MKSPRQLAVMQLIRIEEGGAYVSLVGQSDEDPDFGPRGERQVTDYVAGITRWRRRLDFLIDQFYHGSIERVEPALRQILRLGAFDLLVLGTPPHAAVNEAVALAKSLVRPDAGRLVNAVLRSLDRSRGALPEPTGGEADRLAVLHSHPTWMVERWLSRAGLDQTVALLEANNTRPTYGVRINTLVTTVEAFHEALKAADVPYEASKYLPYFVRIRQLQNLFSAGLIAGGACAIQDEGAGLVVHVLDPQPGDRVIELCAAPGGKSLHAAQRMRGQGEIVAVDVNAARLRLVEHSSQTQRVSILHTVAADARALDPTEIGLADRVLLDAPCSGTGVLAKRADLRWNRRVEDLAGLLELQVRLLDAAAGLVRPGGVLVYATCSIEPDENELRVEDFLQRHTSFCPESAAPFLPDPVVTAGGHLQTLPHVHGTDGAFAARLRRAAKPDAANNASNTLREHAN